MIYERLTGRPHPEVARKRLRRLNKKEQEEKGGMRAVTPEGTLLEHTVLELRVNPPNVDVDNTSSDTMTIITVDSANRPGTLVEVRTARAICAWLADRRTV